MKISSLLLIVLLFILFFTNPSKDEFNHSVIRLADLQTNNTEIDSFTNTMASAMVDTMTIHHNYLFFSTYTIDLGECGGEKIFLGILTRIVPIK